MRSSEVIVERWRGRWTRTQALHFQLGDKVRWRFIGDAASGTEVYVVASLPLRGELFEIGKHLLPTTDPSK